jgi:hypothetical protein
VETMLRTRRGACLVPPAPATVYIHCCARPVPSVLIAIYSPAAVYCARCQARLPEPHAFLDIHAPRDE